MPISHVYKHRHICQQSIKLAVTRRRRKESTTQKNHPHVHMLAINNATRGDAPRSTQQLSHSVTTAHKPDENEIMRMDMSTHIRKTKYKAASLSLKRRNSRVIPVYIYITLHRNPRSQRIRQWPSLLNSIQSDNNVTVFCRPNIRLGTPLRHRVAGSEGISLPT